MSNTRKFFAALVVVLAVMTGLGSLPCADAYTATSEVIQSYEQYAPGKDYPIAFRIKIAKGFYIHGSKVKPGELIVPTSLTFSSKDGLSITGLQYPEPAKLKLDYSDEAIDVYKDEVIVRAVVHLPEGLSPGEYRVKGVLSYQACTKMSCLPPEKIPVVVSLRVASPGQSLRPINLAYFSHKPQGEKRPKALMEIKGIRFHGALWLTLLGLFVGGLALNLTPCIYPLIPITISYFGARTEQLRGKRLIHCALYIGGLSVTNSVLGVSAALSGGMLGAALQKPVVLIVVAGIILAMGMSFFGFWEIRLPSGMVNAASKGFGGFFGSFFMGLTLGVVAAPCLGPFVLGLLTYVGQKGDPFLGFLYFFVLSIGLGMPLGFLAIFSGAVEKLPMSGNWLIWIKKCFGWILVGMAVFMIRPLIAGQILKTLVIVAVVVAAGIHIGFLDKTQFASRQFKVVKKSLGVLLFIVAAVMTWDLWHVPQGIQWIPYKEGILEKAKEEGKPLMIDFYADWCVPCREMDKTTFRDPRVRSLGRKLMAVRVDLTTQDLVTKRVVKRFNIRGVPTVIFIKRDGLEARSLRIETHAPPEAILLRMSEIIGTHDKDPVKNWNLSKNIDPSQGRHSRKGGNPVY